MSWQSEFETGFTTTVTGHDTLTDLLASANAISQDRPFRGASYPCISWIYRDESDQRLSAYGKILMALQIDIWGAVATLDAIDQALLNLLDERKRVAAGSSASPVTMTNWTCKHFRYLRAHTIPTGVFKADSDSSEVIQRVTEWEVRLYSS